MSVFCPVSARYGAVMRHDPTYKDIFAHPLMVEELMRWFVADLCHGRELVDALDFASLERADEQAVSGPAGELRTGSDDMDWRITFRDRPADDDEGWLRCTSRRTICATTTLRRCLRVLKTRRPSVWRLKWPPCVGGWQGRNSSICGKLSYYGRSRRRNAESTWTWG